MKILMLDNYDSFTYNLVHYLKELTDAPIEVRRNDQIAVEEAEAYDKIVLSPGPGVPAEAGIMPDLIARYGAQKSILGICLGMQAIGEAYGSRLSNLPRVYHGVATPIRVTSTKERLFVNMPEELQVGRYHSWVVPPDSLPEELEMTAVDEAGTLMALRHKTYDVRGVQFHPESIMTPEGKQMLANWLNPEA